VILRIFRIDLPDFQKFTDASCSKPLCGANKKAVQQKSILLHGFFIGCKPDG